MAQKWDCILVPGGGLLADGTLPPWTVARLERAFSLKSQSSWFGLLSGGTVHKPPPLDEDGYPFYESRQAAVFLEKIGIPHNRLLTEISSYDTIGNAYFSRLLIAAPFGLERLHVITSHFHLARTRAIFQWVFSLAPKNFNFLVSFEAAPDEGLAPEVLKARQEREQHSLEKLQPKLRALTTLNEFQHWLYTEHNAYAVGHSNETLSADELNSY
jgi:hypothetical protein